MNERTRRNAMILGAIVLALLSIGGGALIAVSDDDEAARPPSPTPTETLSPTPSPDETPSPSPTPRPPRTGADLEDGRHFVYAETASRLEDGSTTVTFDLAYFLTERRGSRQLPSTTTSS